MAKLFFDVFPTLDVSGDMKKILSEMEVTKVGMNHERDHIRVYLLGSHLIHKNNITQLEKSIEEQIFKGKRILIVEDNELNAEIAKTLLSDEGANLTVAEDGLQAVRMFQEKPEGYFDAILMDIMMPVMDGITATKTIRSLKHPDAETIPIIAMTANAFREDKEKCLAAGMNAHLAKPIKIENIKRILYEYCV